MAAVIHTEDLAVSFDGQDPVFEGLNIAVERGEFVAIVGVSGAGKSTLLRVIADLIPPFRGRVSVDAPQDTSGRPIAMVFQAPNLMPWRRVADNITLGLEGIKVSPELKRERVDFTLKLVGLQGYGDRWPYQLSGGQRQRVGIARALAVDPNILLMDEPFGALDAFTRDEMNLLVEEIWLETKKTIVFITHNITEAVFLSDSVYVMSARPGRMAKVFSIPLPRPRTLDLLATKEVFDLVNEIKSEIQHQPSTNQQTHALIPNPTEGAV